jgi:hypothetical protein
MVTYYYFCVVILDYIKATCALHPGMVRSPDSYPWRRANLYLSLFDDGRVFSRTTLLMSKRSAPMAQVTIYCLNMGSNLSFAREQRHWKTE